MFFYKILNFVYPHICVICRKKIKSLSYTCEICASILKYYEKGNVLIQKDSYYDLLFCLFQYEGIIKRLLLQFKFREAKFLKYFFSTNSLRFLEEMNLKFDFIVPVPISLNRFWERGYNQSNLIAKYIGKNINKKVLNILIKVKNNKRQSELGINERKRNVINVYKIKNNTKIKGKVILLIDDIYTTGATVNECARVLKSAGASKVLVLTMAYAKKY